MSFTSNELNFLIWRYLQESGFEHTAYVFGHESELHDSSVISAELPSGSLVSIVQRGLFYIDAEVKAYNNELPVEIGDETVCKLSLIDGAAHLSRLLHEPSTSPVVHSPTPSDLGHLDVAASTSSAAVNTENFTSASPSQSSENAIAVVEGVYVSAADFHGLLRLIEENSRMSRSGPLEALPGINFPVPSIPQYDAEERKNGL